jgi:hypothetical protein
MEIIPAGQRLSVWALIIVICGIYAAVSPVWMLELMVGLWSRYGHTGRRTRGGFDSVEDAQVPLLSRTESQK